MENSNLEKLEIVDEENPPKRHFSPSIGTDAPQLEGELLFPSEIWTIIFSKLKFEDLKNVSLVCKSFNEIIGNSNDLMAKIRILFKLHRFKSSSSSLPPSQTVEDYSDFRQVFSKSVRKHINLRMDINHNLTNDELNRMDWNFLSENEVKDVVLSYNVKNSSLFLFNVLNSVKDSLQSLELYYNRLDNSADLDKSFKKIEWKKLKELRVKGWTNGLIELFPNSLEVLQIAVKGTTQKFPPMEFINQQQNLKCLDIHSNLTSSSFKVACQVKLERLGVHVREVSFEMFKKIFKIQFSCLKHLHFHQPVSFCDFAKIVNQMEKLESIDVPKLYLSDYDLDNEIVLHSSTVKHLILMQPTDLLKSTMTNLVLKGFPNLEWLAFKRDSIYPFTVLADISQSAKNLKSLTLNRVGDTDFKDACFTGLTKLTILALRRPCKLDNMFKACTNLQELELHADDGFYLPETFIEENEDLLKNLKVLRIFKFRHPREKSQTILSKYRELESYISCDSVISTFKPYDDFVYFLIPYFFDRVKHLEL